MDRCWRSALILNLLCLCFWAHIFGDHIFRTRTSDLTSAVLIFCKLVCFLDYIHFVHGPPSVTCTRPSRGPVEARSRPGRGPVRGPVEKYECFAKSVQTDIYKYDKPFLYLLSLQFYSSFSTGPRTGPRPGLDRASTGPRAGLVQATFGMQTHCFLSASLHHFHVRLCLFLSRGTTNLTRQYIQDHTQ